MYVKTCGRKTLKTLPGEKKKKAPSDVVGGDEEGRMHKAGYQSR